MSRKTGPRPSPVYIWTLISCSLSLSHTQIHTHLFSPRPYVLPQAKVDSFGLDVSLAEAAQHLWDVDYNRVNHGEDYTVNVQGGKKPWYKGDEADYPLFSSVNTTTLRSRATYRTFVALLDNYIAETGVSERVTDSERREIREFLDAIMNTAPMQYCHKYCHAHKPDVVPASLSGFKKLLQKIWFDLYRRNRNGRNDSSGFEHVFVGEIKDGKVSGMHNWIQLYLEERKGDLDYQGYIKPKSRNDAPTDGDDRILTLQFLWKGVPKSVGSSFMGTSPEFEMAIFTLCFLAGEEENVVVINTGEGEEYEVKIKCFTMARDKIGTSFPEALSHHED